LNFLDLKRVKQQKLNVEDPDYALQFMKSDSEIDGIAEKEWKAFVAGKAWEKMKTIFKESHLQVYSLCLQGKSAAEAAEIAGLKENTAFVYRKKVQEAMNAEIRRLNTELDG